MSSGILLNDYIVNADYRSCTDEQKFLIIEYNNMLRKKDINIDKVCYVFIPVFYLYSIEDNMLIKYCCAVNSINSEHLKELTKKCISKIIIYLSIDNYRSNEIRYYNIDNHLGKVGQRSLKIKKLKERNEQCNI